MNVKPSQLYKSCVVIKNNSLINEELLFEDIEGDLEKICKEINQYIKDKEYLTISQVEQYQLNAFGFTLFEFNTQKTVLFDKMFESRPVYKKNTDYLSDLINTYVLSHHSLADKFVIKDFDDLFSRKKNFRFVLHKIAFVGNFTIEFGHENYISKIVDKVISKKHPDFFGKILLTNDPTKRYKVIREINYSILKNYKLILKPIVLLGRSASEKEKMITQDDFLDVILNLYCKEPYINRNVFIETCEEDLQKICVILNSLIESDEYNRFCFLPEKIESSSNITTNADNIYNLLTPYFKNIRVNILNSNIRLIPDQLFNKCHNMEKQGKNIVE